MAILRSHLIEPHIVAEEGILVKLGIPSICSPLAFFVTTEDVDDPVLDFLGDVGQVHQIATTSGTLDL